MCVIVMHVCAITVMSVKEPNVCVVRERAGDDADDYGVRRCVKLLSEWISESSIHSTYCKLKSLDTYTNKRIITSNDLCKSDRGHMSWENAYDPLPNHNHELNLTYTQSYPKTKEKAGNVYYATDKIILSCQDAFADQHKGVALCWWDKPMRKCGTKGRIDLWQNH